MSEQKSRFSLEGKLTLIVASLVFVIVVIGAGIQYLTGNALLSVILTAAIGIPLSILAIRTFMNECPSSRRPPMNSFRAELLL